MPLYTKYVLLATFVTGGIRINSLYMRRLSVSFLIYLQMMAVKTSLQYLLSAIFNEHERELIFHSSSLVVVVTTLSLLHSISTSVAVITNPSLLQSTSTSIVVITTPSALRATPPARGSILYI
jgi:hypothetical protein